MADGTEYDARTALVVVDVQNDFADPEGALSVAGGADIVPLVNREVAAVRDAGGLAAYTQDWHPPSTPHFAKDGGTWPVHCVKDTWGAELHPALDVEGQVFRKGSNGEDGYSGFTMRDPVSGDEAETGLAAHLRDHDVERVVVVGLATDVCVKATALDALERDFAVTVLEDATRPVEQASGDGARALEELAAAGAEVR